MSIQGFNGTTVTIRLFGETHVVPLHIHPFDDSQITDLQKGSFTFFMHDSSRLLSEAELRILAYYRAVCDEYRDMFEELADERAPRVSGVDGLKSIVSVESLLVPPAFCFASGKRIINLLLQCTWDELGLAVKFIDNEIAQVGSQDIAQQPS
jgi:hypothetical protein